MRIRKILACGMAACLLALSACGSSTTEKPDLSNLGAVHAVGREEGSGTRTQFETLLNTDESGISEIASSTEDAIETVEKDPSAISYAAMSALPENADVKVLSIDGVQPSIKTIRSKKYPLDRNYYLAWLGNQSDLEQEFVTYVMGAGQKSVAEEAVPVAKETSFLSMKPSGKLSITGSTSMTPLIQKLAEEYQSYNPNAEITVAESDSAKGLTDVMQGNADLAMSSRDLKDYEKEILQYKEIASDAIVILVNQKNALTGLDMSDLKKLFDGKVKDWGDL